eukprot:gene1749-518_t
MDHENVNYSEEIFKTIDKDLYLMLKSFELKTENYKFIPISALENENVFENQTKMKWWSGGTVLNVLGKMEAPKRVQSNNITRFSIREMIYVGGIYQMDTVITGCVLQVIMSLKGDEIFSVKSIQSKESIFTIEKDYKGVKKAEVGDFVGLSVRSGSCFQSGDVIGDWTLKLCEKIQVNLKIQDDSTFIHAGYESTLFIHCITSRVKIGKILFTFDDQTNEIIEKNPLKLKSGDCGFVELIPLKKICVEEFDLCPKMGRIILWDNNKIIAFGIIKRVLY